MLQLTKNSMTVQTMINLATTRAKELGCKDEYQVALFLQGYLAQQLATVMDVSPMARKEVEEHVEYVRAERA